MPFCEAENLILVCRISRIKRVGTMERMQIDDTMNYSHVIEWKIQNFTECYIKEETNLETEAFIAGNLYGTRWVLTVCTKGTRNGPNSLSCFLKRVQEEEEDVGPKALHVCYEFSLITFDGMQMFKKRWSEEFKRNASFGHEPFVTLEQVFHHKEFLLQSDTLTVRCKLRLLPPSKEQYSHHNLVTRFPLETAKESLKFKHFRYITKKYPYFVDIKELDNILWLKVSLNQDKSCQVQVPENQQSYTKSSFLHIVMMKDEAAKPLHVSCWVKLLNKRLEYAIEKQFSHLFSKIDTKEEWILPYFIDTENLEDDCIHEDESLYIDFVLKFSDSPPQALDTERSTPLKVIKDPRENTLMKDLSVLHKANKYSDVNLRIGDETFPAHKSILAARSPRFDEIFTNFKEVKTNGENPVVEIHDVDKNTMALMLKFIYTDKLEDIDDEECSLLSSAAQKYQISSLLFKCLRILRK